MPINSFVKVSQGYIDHTAGYGNCRDSLELQLSRISDNEICDDALVDAITKVLSVRWNTELFEADECHPVTSEEINEGLISIYLRWKNAAHVADSGHYKFFSTLSQVLCTAPMLERMPAMQGWIGFELKEWSSKKRRWNSC